MSCNIAVPAVAGEGLFYPCAFGRTVGWAEGRIRGTYNIIGGSVLCDGVGADEADLIEVGKAYRFVGGLAQGKPNDFSIVIFRKELEDFGIVFVYSFVYGF